MSTNSHPMLSRSGRATRGDPAYSGRTGPAGEAGRSGKRAGSLINTSAPQRGVNHRQNTNTRYRKHRADKKSQPQNPLRPHEVAGARNVGCLRRKQESGYQPADIATAASTNGFPKAS